MSTIKTIQSPLFGKLNMELYGSAQEVANDLETRQITSSRFEDTFRNGRREFIGATKEETFRMLREGYQPTVDALKKGARITATGKRFKSFNDVVGFQPIIPNVIMGLPNAMVNSSIAPIKTKVLDIYYDMTVSCFVESNDLIKAGQKMLGTILEMEAQGYRFNLYVCQTYGDGKSCDMLCVKVKSANQPFDLKRMSFPVSHTAFFRGIGFDWYSKFPLGTYRCGYGTPMYHLKTQDEIKAEFKRLFGKGATYFSAQTIVKKLSGAEEYIKGVLTNDK